MKAPPRPTPIQKKSSTDREAPQAPASVLQLKSALRGQDIDTQLGMLSPGGSADSSPANTLPAGARVQMEQAFGADFSSVRVHEDEKPGQVGALAYAQGESIHFAPGQYDPTSTSGKELIGHELAHVVQQRAGRVAAPAQAKGDGVNSDPALEAEADRAGAKAARGESAGLGNAAGTARAGGPVQMYSVIDKSNPEWRMSANRKIARYGKQALYATDDLILAANQKLASVGAYVKLVKTGEVSGTGNLAQVMPAWDAERAPKTGYHKTLGDKNGGGSHVSHADCHRNAQTVMGSNSGGGTTDTEHPVLKGGTVLDPISNATARNDRQMQGDASHATRGSLAFFAHALPRFADELDKGVTKDEHADLIKRIRTAGAFDKPDKQLLDNGWRLYREIMAHGILGPMFSSQFGINEHLEPEVGQGITQINDAIERSNEPENAKKEKREERDLWNFHWAGVVMKDGADYVTLENLSVEDHNVINGSWYFQMYGPADQSFHSENKKDQHVGDNPLTLGYKNGDQLKSNLEGVKSGKFDAKREQFAKLFGGGSK